MCKMAAIKYILSKIALRIECCNAWKTPRLVPSMEARLDKTIRWDPSWICLHLALESVLPGLMLTGGVRQHKDSDQQFS